MNILLDTNTCIAVMRGGVEVCRRMADRNPDDCGVSVVTIYELLTGVARCKDPVAERRKVELFLAPLHHLPFDRSASEEAAKIRSALERQGLMIGPYDVLLAGQTLALDVVMASRNLREFQRVPGLRVESWE